MWISEKKLNKIIQTQIGESNKRQLALCDAKLQVAEERLRHAGRTSDAELRQLLSQLDARQEQYNEERNAAYSKHVGFMEAHALQVERFLTAIEKHVAAKPKKKGASGGEKKSRNLSGL